MDDDRKKFPRKNGPKPSGGPSGKDGPRRPGKPAFGKKPSFGAKPASASFKKPFVKRDGEAGGERPKSDFSRDKPREGGDARPQGAGAPFRKGPRPDGDRKPYAPRSRDHADTRSDRPAQNFRREERPHADGERPARSFRPAAEGERKPYVKRQRPDGPRSFDGAPAGGDRPRPARTEKPFRSGPRPDAKPYEKRSRPADSGAKPFRASSERKPFAARGAEADEALGERIAKRLARVGIASRRDAEELIAAGRVKVNGKILASPAFNVQPDDIIHLDGMEIPPIERTRLFLFHKPAGVVTTNRDPEGRKTVFDVLPADLPRLMTIGRLDINTEGLLLLTNDGGLSRVLELPATGWLRRYRARVHGKVDEQQLAGLKDGMAVDGVFYGSIEASLDREQGTNAWLTIGLREGKNREVKNILGSLGLDVTRLIRISYGPFQLGELAEGHVLEIKGTMLRDQLGERLIEEAGANFEADIVKPFSNKPTRREREPREEPVAERPKIVRDGERGRIGEGGLIKARKRRENTRDDALGKLSTRPDRGAKPARTGKPERGERPERGGKRGEREQRPIEPPGARKANVWMAPGARPIGTGRAATEKAEHEAKKAARKSYGKPGDGKPGFGKPRGRVGPSPDRERGGSRSGRGEAAGNPPRSPGGKGPDGGPERD